MFAEDALQKWWAARSDEQRQQLKHAAESARPDADTAKLLGDTSCPVGLIGSKWEPETEWGWTLSPDLRSFIAQQ
ncbi:hypothetical protein [Mycolicibacterium fortuitum]|uniref:hypothetical protein n=1 Tax=Mycolicibacterium fortuitum TaxID=1766 RepID=UPI0007EAC4B5|nr:hypothetical protein [Mycolicibacterium fortuitum]OBB44786.1 hypothetical protein A5754_10615 [Mycolicibacterium fortuitum]OBB55788.1 hypothetical protein A5755_29000 [Mycolicibacterium fortuitum]OBF85979.1 hypothetical protein A5751_08940 [Mycolicibacterium fortuitum]